MDSLTLLSPQTFHTLIQYKLTQKLLLPIYSKYKIPVLDKYIIFFLDRFSTI